MLSFLEALVAELSRLESELLIQAIEKEQSLLIFIDDQYKTSHCIEKPNTLTCLINGGGSKQMGGGYFCQI